MKKLILSVLSFVMLLGLGVNNAFALEVNDSTTLSQRVIEITNQYVINENDRLIISNQEELKKLIGSNDFEAVIENINYCNSLIEEDKIGIKENGSLYLENDTMLTIQGGNINATRVYWWGWHRYNDNLSTKKIVKEFRRQVKYSNSWVTEKIFGSFRDVPGGFVIESIPKLLGGTLKNFANGLESKNKGYGTIIAANWVVAGSNIKSQSKNTK